jgi:hypothetical protein
MVAGCLSVRVFLGYRPGRQSAGLKPGATFGLPGFAVNAELVLSKWTSKGSRFGVGGWGGEGGGGALLGRGGKMERATLRADSVSAGEGRVGFGVGGGAAGRCSGGGCVVWSGGVVGEAGRASPAPTGAGVAGDGVGCLGFGGWRWAWLAFTDLAMVFRQVSVLKALMYSCWAWRLDCMRVWSM